MHASLMHKTHTLFTLSFSYIDIELPSVENLIDISYPVYEKTIYSMLELTVSDDKRMIY